MEMVLIRKHSNVVPLIELLSARLFHDIAGSIGAIANCVEFLVEESDEMREESILLLNESSDDLISKFKILRQAYSLSDNNSDLCETKSNIEKYLARKKIKLEWDNSSLHLDDSCLIEKFNKIIVNVIIVCISSMFEGRKIVITSDKNESGLQLKIICEATKIAFDSSITEIFSKTFTGKSLTTKNVQAYFTMLLLEKEEEILLESPNIGFLEVSIALKPNF